MNRPASWYGFGTKVAEALPNPLNYKQRRRLSNFGRQLWASNTVTERVADTYPDPPSTVFKIDLQDLRDTVRSLWRKRNPNERIKIVAFTIPHGEQAPSDYKILSTGNYHNILATFATKSTQCVFYELEDASAPTTPTFGSPTTTVMFNEYIVVASNADTFDQCPIRLNSVLFI